MTKAERILRETATAQGVIFNDTDVEYGIPRLVRFMRACIDMKKAHDKELRDFGPDQFRQARQRIISAGAGFTPVRICRAETNAGFTH